MVACNNIRVQIISECMLLVKSDYFRVIFFKAFLLNKSFVPPPFLINTAKTKFSSKFSPQKKRKKLPTKIRIINGLALCYSLVKVKIG